MFDFPPEYTRTLHMYPNSTLDDMMEFLYQYHYLRIHGQWNTSLRQSIKDDEIYFKFLNEYTVKLFRLLLVLHMESVITLDLRLPKKSEGYIRQWFIDLLKPYNKKHGLFKSPSIDTEDLFRDFDDDVKDKIHEQDTIFTDILVFGYRFVNLFFTLVAEEKWYEFHHTQDEERLIERIWNMIHKNPDYTGEISLHYNIEDYISKNHLDYPIIHNLNKNRFLGVKDIIFKWKELEIILHRFNNFPISTKSESKTVIQNIHMEQNMHMQNISTDIDIDNSIQNINIASNESKKKEGREMKETNSVFEFHEKSWKLTLWDIEYKFRRDSLVYKATKYAFQHGINEKLWYQEFFEEYVDRNIWDKNQVIEMSTMISKYNSIFEERFWKKEFFWRGESYYFRQY